ncbi:MAG: c-type cytochrome [Planctomycetes bacterium]|nr:c-type cytochrome [Planctomycetota bacterium]
MSTAEDTRAHTYDGIEEFDNRLPNWWLWTFYLACIFSVGYWVFYHTLGVGNLPIEQYAVEQAEAAAMLEKRAAENPVTRESLIELSKNPAVVAAGKEIFQDMTKCALCHKPDASGNIGPNLTDDYWIYGNDPMTIYTTILEGRQPDPAKGFVGGMQSWKPFGSMFVQRATAYVLSIMDTKVPGKAPEPNAKQMAKSF